MNTFYLIGNSQSESNQTSANLIKSACDQRGVSFTFLDPATIDWSDLPRPDRGDMLYRAGVKSVPGSKELELSLLNEDVSTFFKTYDRSLKEQQDFYILEKNGISIPETIAFMSSDHAILEKSVEKLGGFPIIVKAMGGSHGIGVMKLDSLSSLRSVADVLQSTNKQCILRKFINATSSARLIVLNGQVIDSIQYRAPKGDFRSNEGHVPNVEVMKFAEEIETTAIKSVEVLGLEFGGVDIIMDETTNQHYVTEVNFPCYFPRCQMLTGTDIAGQMVDHLLNKAHGHD